MTYLLVYLLGNRKSQTIRAWTGGDDSTYGIYRNGKDGVIRG